MRKICVGIDEAGVGTLAGPLVGAVVVLPEDCRIPGVRDSKKMTELAREASIRAIQESSLFWAVRFKEVDMLGKRGIWGAWDSLMLDLVCVVRGRYPGATVLIDGNRLLPGILDIVPVVGGDDIHPCISAASVLAKYCQTCIMDNLHTQFPMYKFSEHHGYPTADHITALKEYGPCPQHRLDYKPLKKIISQRAGL